MSLRRSGAVAARYGSPARHAAGRGTGIFVIAAIAATVCNDSYELCYIFPLKSYEKI